MVTCCTFSTHCVIWSAGPPHRLEEERALMCGLQGEERKSKGRAKSKGKAAAYLRQPGGRDEEQGEEGLASRAWSHCLVTSPPFFHLILVYLWVWFDSRSDDFCLF